MTSINIALLWMLMAIAISIAGGAPSVSVVEQNCNIGGPSIATGLSISSACQCETFCTDQAGCTSWAWEPSASRCHAYNATLPLIIPRPGWSCGYAAPPVQLTNRVLADDFTILSNCSLPGGHYAYGPAPDATTCGEFCALHGLCQGWVYRHNEGSCYLYSTTVPYVSPYADRTCGYTPKVALRNRTADDFTLDINCTLSGSYYTYGTTITSNDCLNVCAATNCTGWLWRWTDGYCRLYNLDTMISTPYIDRICGYVPKVALANRTMADFNIAEDCTISSAIYGSGLEHTLEDCANFCALHTECTAFMFRPNDQGCFVSNVANPTSTPYTGRICGTLNQ